MPFPANEGLPFYFSIPIGGPWRQEFRALDRDAAAGEISDTSTWAGFTASMTISDLNGSVLATLSSEAGADGTITLGDADLGPSAVVCELAAVVTAALPSTRTLAPASTKAFAYAVLWLTDPAYPAEPYPFAVGKGVITTLL